MTDRDAVQKALLRVQAGSHLMPKPQIPSKK